MQAVQKARGRLLLGVSIGGVVVFWGLFGVMQLVVGSRALLFWPVAQALVVLAALVVCVAFLVWGRLPGAGERGAYVAGVVVEGALVMGFQAVAPVVGWIGGPITEAPLLMQGLIYGVSLAGVSAWLLAGYRWLAGRWVWVALVVYAGVSVVMIVGTVVGDPYAMRAGLITFGNGYTVFVDVLYGLGLIWVPVGVYTLLCWRGCQRARATISPGDHKG